MKRLFRLKSTVKGACKARGVDVMHPSKMELKKLRDKCNKDGPHAGTFYIGRGPDHWRGES